MENEPGIFWLLSLIFSLYHRATVATHESRTYQSLFVCVSMSHSVPCVLIELIFPVTKHAHK
jgi:hypothetical protein